MNRRGVLHFLGLAGEFVLACAMFLAALLAHPIHFSIDVLLLTHDATPARGNGWPSESILSSLDPV